MDDLVTLGEHLKRRKISSSDFVNAESLISINDGVRIFNITPDGSVCSPPDSLPVHIIRLNVDPQIQSSLGNKSPTFLHVGDWLYPLVPGVTPVLLSNYGAFIFPDLMTPDRDSFVALMFPEALPSEVRQMFEDLLRSLAMLLVQRKKDTSFVSSSADAKTRATVQQKHMTKLFGAVVWIADEVEKGADMVKGKVMEEAHKLHQKYKPTVEPMVREGIIYAQEVADSRVKISGNAVHKLGEITAALGKDLAAHSKDHPKTSHVDEAGGSTVNKLGEITAALGKDLAAHSKDHPKTSNVDEAGGSTVGDPVHAALYEAAITLERCLANGQEQIATYKCENPV